MKKTPFITGCLITLLLMGGTAFAWHGERGNRGQKTIEQHEKRLERMAVILDLSDDQQKQIKELSTAQWQDHQADRTKLKKQVDEILTSEQLKKSEKLREMRNESRKDKRNKTGKRTGDKSGRGKNGGKGNRSGSL